MKKFFVFALTICAFGFSACASNEFDEQIEACQVVLNKGGNNKTEKVKQTKNEKNGIMLCAPNKVKETKLDKALTGNGKDKNAKNGVEPCSEMSTRSMIIYKPFPNPDKSATKDIPPTLRPLR